MRRILLAVLPVAAAAWSAGLCPAGEAKDNDGLRKENAQLRERVDKLEGDLKVLKELFIKQVAEQRAAARQAPPARLTEAERAEMYKKIMGEVDAKTRPAAKSLKDLDVTLYGYVKLDTSVDTARTNQGNFARWAESEAGRENDSQANTTANQTRVGLKLKGAGNEDVEAGGVLEMDFYGGVSENAPHMRMRHAYMTLDWPKHRLQVLAGQTWDVISPLNPSTVNFTPLWWAGNIGFRRPQVRVTKGVKIGEHVDLTLQGALARTIGHDGPFDPGDTGEDAGWPGLQARAALTFPGVAGRKATLGVSGHWAREEYDTTAANDRTIFDSWSANLDLSLPVCDWMTFKGEIFTGKDLDTYLGGIGQGIDTVALHELSSTGGWGAVSLGPWNKWRFNVGASVEALQDRDVSDAFAAATAGGVRTMNLAVFGNVIYQVLSNAAVMLELSHWHTEYKDLDSGDSFRVQAAFKYDF